MEKVLRKFFMLLTLVLAFSCFTACGKEKAGREAVEGGKIYIGSCGPTSGTASMYGESVRDGVKLAIKEINANGGLTVDGKKMTFELLNFINDEADSDKAAAALNTLMDAKADVIVGAVTSGATEGLIGQAIKVGIPVITPTGTADKLTAGDDGTSRDERSNIYRACFYDSYQGEFMAEYANKLGYKKAYVLYNSTEDYSTGLTKAFENKAKEYNITVTKVGYDKETSDFNSYCAPINSGDYDCVFVPDYYEKAYNIISTLRTSGYKGAIFGADGWDGVLDQFTKNSKDTSALENCFYTNHYFAGSTSAAVTTFTAAYTKEYNETAKSFAVLGYDAVYIFKQAIEKAGSLYYEDIIKALDTETFTGLVTSNSLTFKDGNPQKSAAIITFKNGAEAEAK